MGWNLFKKDEEEDPNLELENRMNASLQKARQDKRQAESTIKQLDNYARDAIIDSYSTFFENAKYSYYKDKHKKTALEEYQNIKEKYKGKIDTEVAAQCDRIVEGYMNQIELTKSKMALYDKIVSQYENLKQKMIKAKEQDKRRTELNEHEDRLKKMDESTEHITDTFMKTNELEDIKNEIEFREEYLNQLEKLSLEFDDKDNYSGALAYKEEVDKMLEKLD
ncbi:MAG: hypothetical protein KAI79_06235 [Bacteroidales bacterium]|nr:hypothetical protein [Bacteroidales bacterium]